MVLYACKPSTHSVETGRPEVHGPLSYVVSLRLTWANLGFMRCYLRQQQQQTRQKTPSNPKQQITKMLNNSNTGTRENKRQCVHGSCFIFGMTSKSDYKQETQLRSQKCYPHRNFLNAQKKNLQTQLLTQRSLLSVSSIHTPRPQKASRDLQLFRDPRPQALPPSKHHPLSSPLLVPWFTKAAVQISGNA